jgi:hypothetical protein
VLKRTANTFWRDPVYNVTRLLFNAFVGLMYGLLFIDLGFSQENLKHRISVVDNIFLAAIVGAMGAMEPMFAERVLLYRERAAYVLDIC